MFKKYSFCAVICIILIQQVVSTDVELKNAKDDAKKAFNSLMKAIDKALTQAQKALNKALDQVKAKSSELEGKAQAELQKILKPLRTKLDKLIEKAKAKGMDLTKCQTYVTDFTNLPNKLLDELVQCINTQVSKAQGYINDALNNCKQIEQDMAKIDQEIDKCDGNKWKQIKCFAKLIEKIAKDTTDAPQHIIEDVTKTTALVTKIIPILEQCFADKLKKAGEDAVKILAEFGICAGVQ